MSAEAYGPLRDRLHLTRTANEATRIRTPREFAERYVADGDRWRGQVLTADRDEEIARWCIAKAEAAEREAAKHGVASLAEAESGNMRSAHEFKWAQHRHEGQAVAWRGTAAILQGLGK